MNGINKVILVGRAGTEIKTRLLSSGASASFSLATNRSYWDKAGQKQSVTDWHKIVSYGKAAEIAEKYVKKGSLLYVEGSLRTRSYDQDGLTKFITEIVVETIQILSPKKKEGGPMTEEQENELAMGYSDYSNDEEIPF
jgi:single-strand DNA-binding protein